jgi:subtilase family serine protease
MLVVKYMTKLSVVAIACALVTGCSGADALAPQVPQTSAARGFEARTLARTLGTRSVVADGSRVASLCAPSADGAHAACLATVRGLGVRQLGATVAGLAPSDLASLYGFATPATQGPVRPVVGVVVAYDYAGAESDLAAYRAHFGLPACSTASGCFTRVGAAAAATVTGGNGVPKSVSAHPTSPSSGWAAEADADIETVSAVCGTCRIVLAEAASDSLSDLGAAVRAAVAAGSIVVSASFGAPEDPSQRTLEAAFEPSPVKVVAAAGDSGPSALFPASASNVIAVAGTTLDVLGFLVTERLWPGSGGGCSAVFARPSYEPAACGAARSVADIAVVADPADGLAMYDSGVGGWCIAGGTSIAAPIVAGMFALSGDTARGSGAQALYAHALLHYWPVLGAGAIAGNGAPASLAAF